MKKEFKQVRLIVKKLLIEKPSTRNSDSELYVEVCQVLNPKASSTPFSVVMSNLEYMGLPCFETVRRTRQKLQAEFPELQASDRVQDFRAEREVQFRKTFRT